MLKNKSIAVLGAGHMGAALVGGMVRGKLIAPKNIVCTRRRQEALEELRKPWGVQVTTDNRKAVKGKDIVVLSVKPQQSGDLLQQIAPAISKEQLIISVMAGIPTEAIASRIGKSNPIVRAMPNTPVLIDQGATAISCGSHAGPEHMAVAEAIFKAVGRVEVLQESLLDAVTGLSGSGPVYIYMVIEAMTDGGVKMGIPRDTALRLSAQTVLGAAKLVLDTGKHPAILKDDVATPGGTAIAAIHELEAKGLRTVLIDAIQTATSRSRELSKLFG